MKHLYDWFWELMDEQDTGDGQDIVAWFFGFAVLVFGGLILWLLLAMCDWLGLNN